MVMLRITLLPVCLTVGLTCWNVKIFNDCFSDVPGTHTPKLVYTVGGHYGSLFGKVTPSVGGTVTVGVNSHSTNNVYESDDVTDKAKADKVQL
ncbi:hypothetical protein RR46_11731 [Papilio xuthus]|uniref:Uncharacterized protein n=1 Tax=Papilio xuthus TaxID=66420 RepID=A0A194PSS2_PAPXU|nr:hypothetical protein RR46_11731 [Papilio xuthus]